MPNSPQLSNPLGAYGYTPTTGDSQGIVRARNAHTSTLEVGDTVSLITTNTAAGVYVPNVSTSATANDQLIYGVIGEATGGSPDNPGLVGSTGSTFATLAEVPVVVEGVARICIGGNTVGVGAPLVQSATAKVAQANTLTTASTLVGSVIGYALEANTQTDANSTIRAYIHKA